MGRVHKKKLAEYAEAAENEEQQKKNNVAENEGEETNSAAAAADEKSGSESEIGELEPSKTAKILRDEFGNEDDDEDFQSLNEDDNEVDKNGGKKSAPKRKSLQNASKKLQEDGAEEFAGEDTDDEPLNGGGSSPAKRGRKAASSSKAKGKAAKGGGRGRGKGAKKSAGEEDDDDVEEAEEEYEVKDIVDHKVERGVTFYLIRWKGYGKDDDTWESEDTLSCPDIIEKYKKKNSNNGTKASQKKIASPGKKGGRAGSVKAEQKVDPNKEWEVEKIIDYSVEKTGRIFRIRWKGFGPKYDTWEPEKNLYCDDLIEKFMKRMESQQNISFKELREEPKKTKRLVNETAPRTNYHNPIGRKSKRAVSKKSFHPSF